MNFAVPLLVLILAAGGVLVMLEAGAAHTTPFVDTYGNTTSAVTNNTQGTIINATAPISRFGTGAVVVAGVIVLFIAGLGIYLFATGNSNQYSKRG